MLIMPNKHSLRNNFRKKNLKCRMENMKSLNYKENHQIKIDVKPLYLSAFPKNERPPAHYFFKKAEKENNDIFAYYENDEFIGFSQLTTYKDICYIFFLAVSENHRNEGYGSKILFH